jgi:hypothetical protein
MTLIATLGRIEWEAQELFRRHPPRADHPNKQRILGRALPDGAALGGRIRVGRWPAGGLPDAFVPPFRTAIESRPEPFAYGAPAAGAIEWHLNFADPDLFTGYRAGLFAQDEIQVAEHPALGAIREALLAGDGPAPATVEAGDPTPITIAGVERRVAIDTTEIYGVRFARATPERIDAAVRPIDPPTVTNVVAVSAPYGGRGRYRSLEVEWILRAAHAAFLAARTESGDRPVTIHTGFWGCGAFGGHRVLMPLLQLVAARWVGIDRVVFWAVDRGGLGPFERARAELEALSQEPISAPKLIARITGLGFEWGVSDGN